MSAVVLPKPFTIKPLPGDLALWIFIVAELLVFALFFISYAITRYNNVELFNQYQLTLDRQSGAINTALLITASFFVVNSIRAVRHGFNRIASYWLIAALVAGFAFLVIKMMEFADKIEQGISLSTNTFYMFYLSLTFFHFMHVIMGMVILGFVALKTWRGAYSIENHNGLESAASYWHMVDLVWIILFPLVYVMR